MYVGRYRPTLKDLCEHVVKEAAYKWRDLGVNLLPYERHAVLDSIEANSSYDAVKCCRSVFQKWLEPTPVVTWNQLIRALRRVQLYDLADRLKRMIREGQLYSTCRQSQVQHVAIYFIMGI